MNKLARALSLIVLAAAVSGCASGLMREAGTSEIRPPAADKAKVVFMRTSFVSSAIGADLFEVVDGQLRFIGVLNKGNKIAYETTPGRKVFMAHGAASDFMLGNLQGGKIYYSIVRPNWGTGGMAPTPIRAKGTDENRMSSPDFASWVAGTTLIVPKENEAKEWFSKEKDRYQQLYTEYWGRFQRKTPEEKAERTLNPEDGVSK
jgi:hypothetical protein